MRIFKWICSFFKWTYHLYTQPATKIGLGILVTGGFIAGAVFWGLFNYGLSKTNEEKFCISCHTMGDNLLPELKKTIHWQNRSGVRAHCPDCHVPHNFTDKIARKMQASREVFAHIIGTIGTREKFKEHRIVLAQREWARFKANNSKECKNCHDYKSMDFSKMRVTSQMIMRSAAERNASCVDCHKGIAHQLPKIQGTHNPAFDTMVSEARGLSVKPEGIYYTVAPIELFAGQDFKQAIGSIEVASSVKVLKVEKGAVQVQLTMWRKNKGFGRVWYGYFGKNITAAILDKKFAQDKSLIKIEQTKVDELTGLEWQKVSAIGWVKSGSLIGSPEVIWNVAKASYSTSCSVCHRQPAEAGHDANQWPGLFGGMVGFTNMDKDTQKLVLKYLQTHSSDFAKSEETQANSAIQTAKP